MSARPVYLDCMATTRLAPEAREAMLPWLGERFGNASSSTHRYGWEAADAVEDARAGVAALLDAPPGSGVVFTSGATEANNTVIKGMADAFAGASTHVVTTAIEHASVLAPCEELAKRGGAVTLVAPGPDGIVDPAALEQALRPDTRLISVMAVNNEIGTVQPVAEVAAIAADRGITFHVDASQAVGKLDFDAGHCGADFLSISAHKVHGPIGIGALYVRAGAPRLAPLLDGGGQERGHRAGTLPVAQAVGFGAASQLASERRDRDAERIRGLATALWEGLRARVDGVELNGSTSDRIPGCLNFSIDGVLSEGLIAVVPDLAISSGSACSSSSGGASHVLRALGLSPSRQASALRVGIDRYVTGEEIEAAVESLVAGVARVRGQGRARCSS